MVFSHLQYSLVSSVCVSKWGHVISVSVFKVRSQSNVWFICRFSSHRRLIYHICLKAFAFKRAFRFLSAVARSFLLLCRSRCCSVLWKDLFVVGWDDGFHIRHARVAELECVSVEDLVQRVIWGKAFVDNAQKFLAKVCFHIWVPWWGCTKWCFFFGSFSFLLFAPG